MVSQGGGEKKHEGKEGKEGKKGIHYRGRVLDMGKTLYIRIRRGWGLTMMFPVRSRNGLGIRQPDQGRVLYCRTDQQIPR